MARSRYKFLESDPSPYFMTATTVNWLPLFSNQKLRKSFFHRSPFFKAKNE